MAGEIDRDASTGDRAGVALWVFFRHYHQLGPGLPADGDDFHPGRHTARVIATAVPIVIIPASMLIFRNTEAITASTIVGAVDIFAGVAGILFSRGPSLSIMGR